MRCEEAENDIADYLAGTLPADSVFFEHLAVCARCREEVAQLRRVWADLDDLEVPPSAPVMQSNLLAAVAEIKPKRRIPMPYIWKPAIALGMALAAIFFGHSLVQPARESAVTTVLSTANLNQAHYRGSPDARVTLVEYIDYQCPPCANYNGVVNEVLQRYGDKVRLEVRHYPLMAPHKNALPASIAAEAAGEQGHFWDMHDMLLSTQQSWSRDDDPTLYFAKTAARLGLDVSRFRQALAAPEVRQRVMNDLVAGRESNVTAAPTFFINGQKAQSAPQTLEEFVSLIDAELRLKK
jgi:protein-disulfide isomerase